MTKSTAQQERTDRRRGLANSEITPPQPEVADPEPLAPTDYTRAESVEVPEEVTTAAALIDWIDGDQGRAETARTFNDARSSPWATVAREVDTILG